jgi:DNA topoisomerase-2
MEASFAYATATWPALITHEFVSFCITPIVKVFKGDAVFVFYTLHNYEEWIAKAKGSYKTKYFKGLGTSTAAEAREALKDIDSKLVAFQRDAECDESMSLAFNSKRADDRKEWLLNRYDPASCIDRSQRQCSISDFINHELIHFSTYDCERSIPNVMDGFKVSQRKIMFVALSHAVKQEMKVGQLAPKVAELTDYHHGEQSLNMAVIGMAQDFINSNNLNLLEPHGAFGTRLVSNGADAASPRYIFTQVAPIATKLFDNRDNGLIKQLESDGMKIEPEYYAPVLPMILINGTLGIGTGFSTAVLKYNPRDLAAYIKALLLGKRPKKLTPWYRGFLGKIEPNGDRKYTTYGVWKFMNAKRMLHITELPIGTWTDDFKKMCEKMLAAKDSALDDVIYGNTDTVIDFKIVFKANEYATFRNMEAPDIVKMFKLSSNLSERNMYLFDVEGKLHYFETVRSIITYYYKHRLQLYVERKAAMIAELEYQMLILRNKSKFIKTIKAGKIDQKKMSEKSLLMELIKGFDADPRASGKGLVVYTYLIDLSYRSFTNENAAKMDALVAQKNKELKTLKATPIQTMWLQDIDAIVEMLD